MVIVVTVFLGLAVAIDRRGENQSVLSEEAMRVRAQPAKDKVRQILNFLANKNKVANLKSHFGSDNGNRNSKRQVSGFGGLQNTLFEIVNNPGSGTRSSGELDVTDLMTDPKSADKLLKTIVDQDNQANSDRQTTFAYDVINGRNILTITTTAPNFNPDQLTCDAMATALAQDDFAAAVSTNALHFASMLNALNLPDSIIAGVSDLWSNVRALRREIWTPCWHAVFEFKQDQGTVDAFFNGIGSAFISVSEWVSPSPSVVNF